MPPSPRSPYALQKWTGETYCRLYTELYGLETVALRYFNVFGPRQDPESEYAAVIPRFVDRVPRAARRRSSTATASRRATSPSSRTRSSANLLAADAHRRGG